MTKIILDGHYQIIRLILLFLKVVEPTVRQTDDSQVTARLTEQLQAAEVGFNCHHVFKIFSYSIHPVQGSSTIFNKETIEFILVKIPRLETSAFSED